MAGEKILDIDDSPTVQRLIEMILSSQGYQVVLASDGEEGIAKARSERPALILVDFVMPKMNGFQVCKTLKEDPEFKDVPIILVTSKGDKVGSKFVDVLGITEYFTKPFQPEELLAKIREVLDKRIAASAPAAAPAAMHPAPAAHPSPGPRATEPSAPSDAMVRTIVERVVEELKRSILPDLVHRELMLARKTPDPSAAETAPPSEPGIRGDLASFPLVEVLQMLGLQRQTGRLSVTGGQQDLTIYFQNGSVAFAANGGGASTDLVTAFLRKSCRIEDGSLQHARHIANMTGDPIDKVLVQERIIDQKSFVDHMRRATESAVFRAMALKKGSFVFDRTAVIPFSLSAGIKVDDLLLEGSRRSDEWVLIQQRIPHFGMVFESMIGNAEELSTRGLSDSDTKVFSLIDGRRTAQNIIDELNFSEFDVAKSLFILLSVNLIRQKR